MRKFRTRILFPVLIFAYFCCSAGEAKEQPEAKTTLLGGTAKIMITPQTPIPMSGYGGREGPFKGVHDDLFARAIVFSDGEHRAAIVTAELIGLSHSFWEEFTHLLEKETGIKKEYVLMSAVHTHGGPVTTVYNEDSSPEVLAYVEEVKTKLVAVTKDAMKNMVTVSIGAGKGECKMNVNRRAPDGKGGVALGLNPYAPCDHEVGVIRVDDVAGNNLALLINWPCHGVVLGPRNYLITSDWPGAASKCAEEALGDNSFAMVTIGASGDINPVYGPHIDFEDNNAYAYGKDAIGEDLANETLRVMKNIKTTAGGTIRASQRVISLPAKEGEEIKGLQPDQKDAGTIAVRLSALKIGNIILTGVSGEVFNQISVKMRTRSPYANTFMITHCNGSSGYLVTEDAYPVAGKGGYEDKSAPRGGYEPTSTRVKTGAEKAIIENLLEMINEL